MTIDQNNLSMLNYRFSIARSPEIQYRAQMVTLPGLNLGVANQPTPFVPIPRPGNLTYDDLTIQFQPSENLTGYLDIVNWMVALGHPDNYEQYPVNDSDINSDLTVQILDSKLKVNCNVLFTNAFPINLSPLQFDATMVETAYQTVNVVFRFERFYFNLVE